MVHWQTRLARAQQVSPPPLQLGLRLKETFLVTGSQDCTVKLWPLPKALLFKSTAPDSDPVLLQAQTTQRSHDKVTTHTGPWGAVLQGPYWSGVGVAELPPIPLTRTSIV